MRVKDLWYTDTAKTKKSARHPDRGGNKDAKRWLAVWIGPDGREQTKAFRLQDQAAKYARRMEEDIERGEYIDPKAGRELVSALGRKWLRLRDVGAGSTRRYESAYRLHIEPAFGHRQVKSIKASEVLEWLRNLAKTHESATQEVCYFILCGIFDLAVADKMRRDNPARSDIIPKPTKDATERDAWTVARVWSVIDAHPAPYRAIPVIAAGCGLRQGEVFGLGEEDIDLKAGRVHIRRQLVRVGKTYAFKAPKGGRERVVPLSPGVARHVETHLDAHPPRPYALPWLEENGALAAEEHVCKLVFRWHGDDPRTHDERIRAESYDQSVWKPALVKADVIPPREKGKRYTAARRDGMHALRHYYATTLLDAGVSLAGVMEFLGHSRKGKPVTLGVYAHVTETTFESARNAIDRSLFRLRPIQDQQASGTVTELAVSE